MLFNRQGEAVLAVGGQGVFPARPRRRCTVRPRSRGTGRCCSRSYRSPAILGLMGGVPDSRSLWSRFPVPRFQFRPAARADLLRGNHPAPVGLRRYALVAQPDVPALGLDVDYAVPAGKGPPADVPRDVLFPVCRPDYVPVFLPRPVAVFPVPVRADQPPIRVQPQLDADCPPLRPPVPGVELSGPAARMSLVPGLSTFQCRCSGCRPAATA